MQPFLLLSPLLGFFFFLSSVWAQLGPFDPTGFTFVGRIDNITLNTAGGALAGGTITMNGITIVVPDNTLATLPSIAVAWGELFTPDGAPNLPRLGQVSWEASVFGNIVHNQYIAGLIFIAQDSIQSLQGFITSIDTATGIFTVGATSAAPVNGGFKLVLNDPLGTFGRPYTNNPLWSVDPVNPSVRANNGFPVCIPRNSSDPLCPLSNRPKDAAGNFLTTFTFGNPATLAPGDPDPRIMVPLVVGDSIVFSGTDVGNGTIAVYSLVANLGILTAPGTHPVYVTCESAQYGIVDNQDAEVAETRAVAWTTDPTSAIQWFAMDVDPCTGEVTERNISLVQPTIDAPAGKTVFRTNEGQGVKIDASPPTRNVGFRSFSGTSTGPNGITAGEFIQPIMDFIFPEQINFGSPPLLNSFQTIPFLASGSGPYIPGNLLTGPLVPGVIVGQLSPWPGTPQPATTSCAPPSATSIAPAPPASSTPATPPPPPVPDTVTIVAVSQTTHAGGFISITVVAKSSNAAGTAILMLSIGGNVPAGPLQMNNDGAGNYSLQISVKTPRTVTVTSNGGGTATQQI